MPVEECMEKTTHRQFIAWMHYLRNEYIASPTRSDYYLMQVAREVRGCLTDANPSIIDMKLPEAKDHKPITKKTYLRNSRNAWFGGVGLGKPND